MTTLTGFIKGISLSAVVLLSACATSVSMSDLYQPNYGRQVLPHWDASADPDPVAISNGLYTPRPLQQCYLCSSQSQLQWSGWAP
jgi:hypothetical protein